jgi:7-keto-8-aminopelargonate synthetase-like enzyme
MIIGSLAGPICSGGGFCAASPEVVEHQRIMAAAYTYSAALPAMLATTASETIKLLQDEPEMGIKLKDNIDTMWEQFNPKNFPKQQWVVCTSARDNPIMLLILKDEIINRYTLSPTEQQTIMQEIVDEVNQIFDIHFNTKYFFANHKLQSLKKDVLITRLRNMPQTLGTNSREQTWQPQPALKICMTNGLSKKEVENAGTNVRRAIHAVMERRKFKR